MRLLTKNTIALLFVTIIVFILGSLLFYFQLKKIMDEEAIEALDIKKEEVLSFVTKQNKLPDALGSDIDFQFTKTIEESEEQIKDTVLFNSLSGENLPYKQLKFSLIVNNELFDCIIRKSLFESDDLIETILISFLIIIIVVIILFIGFNYLFAKITWKPFFTTLGKINEFAIDKNNTIPLVKSSTKEFDQLNAAIFKMTSKINSDYEKLKSFTENASHELQTPLAIIKGKTDLLIQTEGLTEEQIRLINEIDQTTTRLKKLNQTLLLLSKIENNQFKTEEEIEISGILKRKLEEVDDLLNIKNIKRKIQVSESKKKMHPILVDILISNLISNAIKYTPENGEIEINLNSKELLVSNTGLPLKGDENQLFERFYKEGENSDSTGLGLALVKQIAIINNNKVNYKYSNNKHIFNYVF